MAEPRTALTPQAILDSVMAVTFDGVMTFSPVRNEAGRIVDFSFVSMNDRAERITGRTRDVIMSMSMLEAYPGVVEVGLFARYCRVVETGQPDTMDLPYDQDELHEWLRVQAVRAEPDGLTIAFSPITALKRTEHQLNQAKTALRQLMSVVSHDVQAPLRHIAVFASMIERDAAQAGLEGIGVHCRRIADSIGRLQRLTRGLLTYSQMEAQLTNVEPIDLDRLVEDVAALVQPSLAQRQGRLHVDALPQVWGNPDLLVSVFLNLIDNAIKYSTDAAPDITVTAQSLKDDWLISVVDHGIGIDPVFAERIFEPFRRLATGPDRPEGSGMGLAICRQIVEGHGGRIWLDPEYRSGSRFLFTLPKGDRRLRLPIARDPLPAIAPGADLPSSVSTG